MYDIDMHIPHGIFIVLAIISCYPESITKPGTDQNIKGFAQIILCQVIN